MSIYYVQIFYKYFTDEHLFSHFNILKKCNKDKNRFFMPISTFILSITSTNNFAASRNTDTNSGLSAHPWFHNSSPKTVRSLRPILFCWPVSTSRACQVLPAKTNKKRLIFLLFSNAISSFGILANTF